MHSIENSVRGCTLFGEHYSTVVVDTSELYSEVYFMLDSENIFRRYEQSTSPSEKMLPVYSKADMFGFNSNWFSHNHAKH